ncbi:MAG: 16S rRNA (guanine(966)-N(2))-methyltransferase RsmD [Nocardioidaceae bacterium]
MTRIIAGSVGGRRIRVPAGSGTRPTSDRVREALFSALESALAGLHGLHVLDLYAGSGALGLEALSRGAVSAVLVESDRRALELVRRNIATLGLSGAVAVGTTAERYVQADAARAYDVVLLDPPYSLDANAVDQVLADLVRHGWLAPRSSIVVERSSRTPRPTWPDGVDAVRSKSYGETTLWYGRRAEAASPR